MTLCFTLCLLFLACVEALVIRWLYRRNNFLFALLLRTNADVLKAANGTLATLCESFSKGPVPSLDELANHTEDDFKLTLSDR
jgi:hypothetical protein